MWALDRVPWHATQSSLHSALEKPGRLLSELVSLAADCCAPSPGGAQLVTLSAWTSATTSLPPAVRHHGEGQERLSFLHGGGQSGEQPRGKCLLHASPVGTSPQPTLLLRKGGWAQGTGTAREAGSGTWLPGRGPWALGVQGGGRWGAGTVPGKPGTALEQKDGTGRGVPGSWACHIITGEKLGQSLALSASV